MKTRPRKGLKIVVALALLGCAVLVARWLYPASDASADSNALLAKVERRAFSKVVHRSGVLQPLKEENVFAKVQGTIKFLVPQGTIVKKGDVVMTLEDQAFQDAREDLLATIRSKDAENEKARQTSAEALNQAQQDVIGFELRLELENMRLSEIKKGPLPNDQVTAETDIQNSQALLDAATDTNNIYQDLAKMGYAAREDARAKKLAMDLQEKTVDSSKIKLTRLDTLDPNTVATQEQAVRGAEKTLTGAKKRVALLESNIARDEERFKTSMDGLKQQLKKRTEDLDHCTYTAPGDGVVIYAKGRWYAFAPGRQVWDGVKVMSIPDFAKMKVMLTIDEARVSEVHANQSAEIRPAGWRGAPFRGIVRSIAEKGRDEFELFLPDTTAISGTANRQVFDVTVEVEGSSDALRLGLRADVDVVTQKIDTALVVPRMAVIRDSRGQSLVNVDTPAGPQRRNVSVLAQDEFDAALEGVNEGERVWLLDVRKKANAGTMATINP